MILPYNNARVNPKVHCSIPEAEPTKRQTRDIPFCPDCRAPVEFRRIWYGAGIALFDIGLCPKCGPWGRRRSEGPLRRRTPEVAP
jgi:hypothetical protein